MEFRKPIHIAACARGLMALPMDSFNPVPEIESVLMSDWDQPHIKFLPHQRQHRPEIPETPDNPDNPDSKVVTLT